MTARILGVSAALITILLVARAHAVSKTWIGSDGGTYSTASNWDPGGTPGAADSILFANGTVLSNYDISFDADSTVTQLTVATNPLVFGGSSRSLSLTSTANSVDSSRALVIGRTISAGTNNAALTSTLANLNTTYAVLGADTGSIGTLNVTAGTFRVTGTAAFSDLLIGDSGTGTINIKNGAAAIVSGDTNLATFGTSVGNISVIGSGSTWTNTGTLGFLKGGGTITVADGGNLIANARLDLGFGGGKLAGNGTVTASVSNAAGVVAPSSLTSAYGTLNISGFYTQTTNGKLQIELHGTTAGSYDRLNVLGSANLGGTLQVTLSSFTPAQNDVFDILDFTTRSGTFGVLSLPTLSGSLEWDTSKLYVDGTIRVALPGDFNNSGAVDANDYAIWRKGQGTTYTASDYDKWRSHFGGTASSAGAGTTVISIPEPATALLFWAAAISASCVRFARSKNRSR